jgi:hypothetical protein
MAFCWYYHFPFIEDKDISEEYHAHHKGNLWSLVAFRDKAPTSLSGHLERQENREQRHEPSCVDVTTIKACMGKQ